MLISTVISFAFSLVTVSQFTKLNCLRMGWSVPAFTNREAQAFTRNLADQTAEGSICLV